MAPHAPAQIVERLERVVEERADEHVIERPLTTPRRRLLKRVAGLVVTGVSLYLVAPSLLSTLSSWDDLQRVGIGWLAVMAALQTAALGCLWILQRIALRTPGWYAVITSQLAGGALAKIAPGGGVIGGALQYRMLVTAGTRPATTASSLTAVNLLTFAAVLALPVLALPSIVRGTVNRSLVEATLAGAGAFLLLLGLAIACVRFDAPLAWIGHTVQRLLNRLRRGREPQTGLPDRLLHERDRILAALGPRYRGAVAATIGRWAFDYATLLAALAAVGSHPRPSLVLLAFCAAQLLGQIPITPGGLGFVEAGLAAMLELAGVSIGNAVLATFAYRLIAYWLQLPAGLAGYLLHRRRFPPSASAVVARTSG
jgi:uncharacterized protein (TIRG00374 family)